MANFKMKGSDLYDSAGRKVATVRANDILDRMGRKVGSVRGDDIRDKTGNKVGRVQGSSVYDGRNIRIASLSDVRKTIDGAMGGVTVAALWLFFIR